MKRLWFAEDRLYIEDREGHIYHQSLLWYPRLAQATDKERADYELSNEGIHWSNVGEDVSFESFSEMPSEPSPLQRFFLQHKEISVSQFAKRIGLDATHLRNYINGFNTPSEEKERYILQEVRKLGEELASI